VMNLSGECTDTSAKYKIRGYDKDYADSLKSDKNFNIVALSSECITAECPNPPYSSNFSAFDIPSSESFTI
jgi:hypothetical protein